MNWITGIAVVFGLILGCQAASGEVIYYHSNTIDGGMLSSGPASYPAAVLYDLPDPTKSYNVKSLSIWSEATDDAATYPQGTEIKIWVWDSTGAPIYTSSAFDVSGQSGALAYRTYFTNDDSFTVSGSFYAGFQDMAGFRFGYKTDLPRGSQYGRSYKYKVSTATMRPPSDDDYMFEVDVAEVSESPTPGDTNDDHIVDSVDLGNLVAQFGGLPGADSADFSGNNFVGLEDFATMRGNYGFGVVSATDAEFGVATPEPATLSLFALGGLAILRRRRSFGARV